ncbi:hypothetical protein [Rufibacter psychrotolerans]|uniref:hypothetical protein n=1 Tax=Rufibacter psychrotolerans TaxID=2812556 RepID=UPI0019675245|nr:hypothetical protein [Rufibacter sp. SYSU D00308]
MKSFYKLKSYMALRFLILALLALLVLNLASIFIEYYLNEYTHSSITATYTFKRYVTELFNFDGERNLPTYFSTMNLLISAVILFAIGRHLKRSHHLTYHKQWFLMGWIFVWLGVDELISIHELLVKPSRSFLKTSLQQDNLGLLNFGWFVPYILLFGLIGLYLVKFVLSLPRKTLVNFVAAGAIFLFGAVGMEMVGGLFIANQGDGFSLAYKLLTSFEEMLEMLGIIFFIYSLVRYIETQQELKDLAIVAIYVNPEEEKAPAPVARQEEALAIADAS